MAKRFLIALVLLTGFALCCSAQVVTPVKWTSAIEKISDNEAIITFSAKIDAGWHMYSTTVSDGPVPTRFTFEEAEDFELVGGIASEKDPVIIQDSGFGMELETFEDEAVFKQRVRIVGNGVINAQVEYMCCNNRSCSPPMTESFSLSLDGKAIHEGSVSNGAPSLWVFFWIAFLAGLAGILTPCVLPMVPMTVSFFLRNKKKSESVIHAFAFGLSIVVSYTLIGVILGLTGINPSVATQISTHWISNGIFFILFAVFALSFMGCFELTLPSGLANRLDRQVDRRNGVLSVFFMALVLVLVSFSCTGPIIGALLIESAGGVALKPVIGMLGFSVAFSLPFILLALFPSYISKLPKSGNWMKTFKMVLALLLWALSLKFLSTIDQVYHLHLISRGLFLSIWILIFVLMAVILWRGGRIGKVLSAAAVGFVIYLAAGFAGLNRLEIVSSVLPPATSQPGSAAVCGQPKYSDLFSLPYQLPGYFDYGQGLSCAMEQDKPMLLVFKGHACSNCKQMEASIWSETEVLKALREDFVIVALYVDDRTVLPEEDWISCDGKTLKTIGQINSLREIEQFGANTVPLYVILDENEKVISGPLHYESDPDLFLNFLNRGSNTPF